MRQPPSTRSKLFVAATMLGVAAGLYYAPDSVTSVVRSVMQDAVGQGTGLLNWSVASSKNWTDRIRFTEVDTDRIAELETELAAAKAEARAADARAISLNEKLIELAKNGAASVRPTSGKPLFVPELIEASILGETTRSLWRDGKLIDKGTAAGLTESLLVVDDDHTLIDQGSSSGIEPEQDVYTGRIVIGRVATVGRWTSSIERVTDKNYRGLAQLARKTSSGLVLGGEGILEGDGSATCRLRDIPVTESVEVGDDVYTGGRDGRIRSPMYYGTIIEARLNEGDTAWEIRVKPAAADAPLRTVNVLRTLINPHRVVAQ
jgi:cell shape-determining protein MreC